MKVELDRYYYDEAHDTLIMAGCAFPFVTVGLGLIVTFFSDTIIAEAAKIIYIILLAYVIVRWIRLRILAAKQTRIINGNKNKHNN